MSLSTLLNQEGPIIKTRSEIEILREGGKLWSQIRLEITPLVQEGVSGEYLQKEVEILFEKHGVTPSFNKTKKFPGIICISINDCVVHGLANDNPLKKGDKITLDIGFIYKGLNIDSAFTLLIDESFDPEYKDLIDKALLSLWAGIKSITPNCPTGAISEAVETYVSKNLDSKYKILDSFTGHGIGHGLHERPYIYNKGLKSHEGPILPPNSVICIEPMLLEQDTGAFKIGENGYDVLAVREGARTVHWEHMVLIGKKNIEILTASDDEIKKYYEQ